MLRSKLLSSVIAAVVLAVPALAQAGPPGDLMQAWRNFGGLKSFHADMKTPGNLNIGLDQIMPDKMRITTSEGMQMIRIGSDMWIYRGGSWMKIPVAMPQMASMGQAAQTMGMSGKPDPDTYTITDLGPAVVNGTAAHHYRIASKDNSERPVEMWIGANHLPLEIVEQTDKGPMTILYSHYNAVPDITPPV